MPSPPLNVRAGLSHEGGVPGGNGDGTVGEGGCVSVGEVQTPATRLGPHSSRMTVGQSKSEPMESGLRTSPLGVLRLCWTRVQGVSLGFPGPGQRSWEPRRTVCSLPRPAHRDSIAPCFSTAAPVMAGFCHLPSWASCPKSRGCLT